MREETKKYKIIRFLSKFVMKKKKSFLAELQEYKKKTNSRRRGVVAVLAWKNEIEQGLEAGFTLTDIYSVLSSKGKMPITYSGFVKLVRKYIQPKEQPTIRKQNEPKGIEQIKKTDKDSKKGYVYNPDNHNLDNLL